MSNETKIQCPGCGREIDVNSALDSRIRDEYRKKFTEALDNEKSKIQEKEKQLLEEKQKLQAERENQDKLIAGMVDSRLKKEKEELEAEIKKKISEEEAEKFRVMEEELNNKSEKLKELNKTKAEFEKLKREKEELQETLEAENQRKLNELIAQEKEKIRKAETDKNELVIKELKKQLEDQMKLTEEMKRKQEQGSMQLQGEVQELAIEVWLSREFPLDTITEIKKGERGADCLQTVNTNTRPDCGTIYYESKRAKDFKYTWIEKFKEDIRAKSATIGVLVTDCFPKGMERMALIDGVWVCSYDEFKGLCHVLRDSIIQISAMAATQENKGEKMTMLYNFLTGNEFRMQVEGIVEGFTQMQEDLNAEKRAIISHWKKREKQIQKVILNTNNMYGSIKGIAGNAIQSIQQLELPTPEVDDNDVPEEE